MTESVIKQLNTGHSTKSTRSRHTAYDSLMRYARFLGYGDVHVKFDEKTGLHAIVAIHNLNRGPAIGGCRFINYNSMDKAMEDALRLGYMMSYKAAIVNLPHGGAKSVIIKPRVIKDRTALLEKFGEFVEELGGRYITAVDSGTSTADMDIIARRSAFVTCTTRSGGDSDPSPLTALGVRRGIEAAVKFQMDRDTLDGIHVAVQGAGNVGFYLAKELTTRGARVTITDIKTNSEMTVKEIRMFCQLGEAEKNFMKAAVIKMYLSARSYHRILKLGRTIADLSDSSQIQIPHLAEAVQYRPKID